MLPDSIHNPGHYTVYPVQPIEITRHLGFCLGNATKYVLRAPYKGGVEDCDKAIRYLEMEKEIPQRPLYFHAYQAVHSKINMLIGWLYNAPGDILWSDMATLQAEFLDYLRNYVWSLESFQLGTDKSLNFASLKLSIDELRRVLALRDTTGQIYEGMTGLPRMEADNG